MTSRKRSRPSSAAVQKEWDKISCPICMDHPQNAVLFICSSYEKGCRCYICDTSTRQSNCLDRFKKMNGDSKASSSHSTSSVVAISSNPRDNQRAHSFTFEPHSRNIRSRRNFVGTHDAYNNVLSNSRSRSGLSRTYRESRGSVLTAGDRHTRTAECVNDLGKSTGLKCPLCRGNIYGWIINEEARKYLDQKKRTCCHDQCKFVGNYEELRVHARKAHPTVRVADEDPSRRQEWQRLEQEQEYNDVLSAIRSEIPGATVEGDYVIEPGEDLFPANYSSEDEVFGGGWLQLALSNNMLTSPVRSREDRRGAHRLWSPDRHPEQRNRRTEYLSDWHRSRHHLVDRVVDLDDYISVRRRRLQSRRSRYSERHR